MPIAAVPAYLGHDFREASPGMRFGMYLKLWGINRRTQARLWTTHDLKYEIRGQNQQERELKEENKTAALRDATPLTPTDKRTCAALLHRQQSVFDTVGPVEARLCLEALATAPFSTGLGNAHPLENGFAFLNPYGLPYLPGSGVKGVLRQAARELATEEWGDTHGWTTEKIHLIECGKDIPLSPLDVLFGLEPANGETAQVRGALTFWDVIPQIKGERLMVEIMTPHQSHYYQQKCDRKAGDSATPHDSGQPNPISFLTVPPGSGFVFHVCCDLAHLERLAPDLAHNGRWKVVLKAAFEHAFHWLGFGAKTAVGYGAMQEDPKAKEREQARHQAHAEAAQRAKAEAERQAALAQMSPLDREIREFLDARQDKNQPEWSALLASLRRGHWSGQSKVAVAKRAKSLMQEAKKWKEKSEKKNPAKDNDYQDTLSVMAWIKEE
jgi:CRISPR-associated protein Cmr6